MKLIEVILSFTVFFVLPGYLLASLILPKNDRRDVFFIIPVSAIFGAALASIISLPMYLFRLNIIYMGYFMAAATCVLALILYVRSGLGAIKQCFFSLFFKLKAENYVFFTMLLAVSVFSFLLGGIAAGVKTYDSYYFIAAIRKIYMSRTAYPFCPFLGGTETVNPFYPYNLLFTIFGFIAAICNVDPLQLWLWLPALIMPLSVLALYCFLKELFIKRGIAIFIISAVMMIELLHPGQLSWYGMNRWQSIAYPNKIGFYVLIPVASAFLLAYFRKGKIIYLLSGILSLLALMPVYFGGVAVLVISFMLFILLFIVKKYPGKKIAILKRAGLSLCIITVIYGIYALFAARLTGYSSLIVLRDITATSILDSYKKHFYIFNKYIFMLKPSYFFDDWTRIVAIPIAFYLLFKPLRIGTLFIVSVTLGLAFILLFPICAGLFGNALPWLFVERLKFQIPSYIIVAYFLYWAVRQFAANKERVFLIMFVAIFVIVGAYKTVSIRAVQNNGVTLPCVIKEFIVKKIPAGSMILSDEYSSLVIPAISDLNIISTAKGVTVLAHPDGGDRLNDIRMLRNEVIAFDKMQALLRKYKVEYILVHKSSWCDEGKRFDKYPDVFSQELLFDGYVIYKIKSSG